ncbi:MAG: UDP-N-acetylmuramoyl-L-alanine--D-glutamate ligase [Deltaproteobacteria bacterium]|nr:UDP-N-acetylmuramoyl-L-alanine--D-glutamate ligase [Deltaproteobacteria bacterium]
MEFKIDSMKGKKVLVVGLGKSGLSALRFLHQKGALVTVTDARREEELKTRLDPTSLQLLTSNTIKKVFGSHPPKIFEEQDLIVLSPGVPTDLPGIKKALKKKIPVWGEMELACRAITIPIIAVTGTNGKSTTVTLIHEMLKKGGKRVLLGGNIGTPLIDFVEPSRNNDLLVVEVSSFQLETIQSFHPKVAVLLNIAPDHLDRYSRFTDYVKAKARLIKNQDKNDLFIGNGSDKYCLAIARKTKAKKCFFSSQKKIPGGLFLNGSEINYQFGKNKEVYLARNNHLTGLHNKENMMAAIATARHFGVSVESIQGTLDSFLGLKHRMEYVRETNGVTYYNDSKGTNVSATLMALAGLPDKKVLLIAGGRDKGSNYKPLKTVARKKLKGLYLIGEAAEKIRRELGGQTKTVIAETLEKAVYLVSGDAAWGDIILFSPACASYDQFKNFEHRGETFKNLVMRL